MVCEVAGWTWAQEIGATQIRMPDFTPLGPEFCWSGSLLVHIRAKLGPLLGVWRYIKCAPKVGRISQIWAREALDVHGLRNPWLALVSRKSGGLIVTPLGPKFGWSGSLLVHII